MIHNSKQRFSNLKLRLALIGTAIGASTCLLHSTACNAQILSPPERPIDSLASTPIRRLLNEDWERHPKIELRSQATYASAPQSNDDLLVAYTINRIRHNKTSDAKIAAQELTDRHSDNLDGWMFKTWLNTLTNDYDVALINMRMFKKQIEAQTKLPEKTQQEIFRLAAGLKPEILKTFNENRDRVLKKHDDLMLKQGQKTKGLLEKTKIENQVEADKLDRQNQLLEQAQAQLLPQKQKISEDASDKIASVEQQGYSLQQQLNKTGSDIQATQLDLQFLYRELALIQRQPIEFRQSTFFLRNQIRDAELTLGTLRRNADITANQLNNLRAQIAQIQASADRQVDQIDKEIKRVNNDKQRNLSKLIKIAKGPELAGGKRGSLKSRLTGLRTYDDLTLELYRQDILSQLSK